MLVDDVGHDENDRPEHHARGERQRAALPEQAPVEWRDAERILEREDLDADELGDQGIGDEEAGRARGKGAPRARRRSRPQDPPAPRPSGRQVPLDSCFLPPAIIRGGPRAAGIIRSASMDQALLDRLESQTAELASAGLFKRERVIASPQDPVIRLEDGREVLNFCANNYLGLAHHPAIVAAAHAALDRYGYGMASVRFICGTQTVHRSSSAGFRPSSAPRTRSSTPPVSTPTAACSRRSPARRTRSSRMR